MDTSLKKNKNSLGGFASLVVAMLFYSVSGVMVTWLGIAFNTGGQLIIRSIAGVLFAIVWILLSGSGFRLPKNKYNNWALFVDVITRPMFNYCFIMAVFGFEEATFALLLLFSAKVITGGFISKFYNKVKLGLFDYFCYCMVLMGIVIYNDGNTFELMFLWAIASGVLEAIKSEAMSVLDVDVKDTPIIALYEFLSVMIAGLAVMMVYDGGMLLRVGGVTSGFTTDTFWGIGKTYWGIVLAFTAVLALAFELYGFSNFSPDLGNVILATELGVAGFVNFHILSTAEKIIPWELPQWIALTIFVLSAFLVSKAESFRPAKKL